MHGHDEKEKRNHTGQMPTDIPSEKLIHPPKNKNPNKINRKPGHNSTGKDPLLGSRHATR